MNNNKDGLDSEVYKTIVIGGGQAGLATGYFLKQLKQNFIILDSSKKTGDSWRHRWDSLRAFTPGRINGLPGMPFPGPLESFPSKDEIADFLAKYRDHFQLPVIYDVCVTAVTKSNELFEVVAGEEKYYAKTVVVATGNYTKPKVPAFASTLSPAIHQLHTSAYKSADKLPDGDVLVVGAGTSGLQIAVDLVNPKRKIYVSGTPPARIPDFIFKYLGRPFVWFAGNILTIKTPMGRKVREALRSKGKGAPLINISLEEVEKKGVVHIPRIAASESGWPLSNDGKAIHVKTIIWATGFLPDYSWINLPGILDESGYPATLRGVSSAVDGLFFAGSLFQYSLTSTWIWGAGNDARFIAMKIADYIKSIEAAPSNISKTPQTVLS